MKELNANAMGYSAAVVSAAVMLLLGILGNLGTYMGGVKAMQQWHLMFNLSVSGIILGMIEAAIVSYVLVYALIYLYNKFNKN